MQAPEFYPLRILVVENHEDTRVALKDYLEMLGHTVLTASCVSEALSLFPSAGCSVLLCDIGLPDGDGWELLSKVRAPVFAVAMSGLGLNADRLRSAEVGFRHHLLKPFVPEELDAILAEASTEGKQAAGQARVPRGKKRPILHVSSIKE
jgi:two-component system CheB/CheR fusion protein